MGKTYSAVRHHLQISRFNQAQKFTLVGVYKLWYSTYGCYCQRDLLGTYFYIARGIIYGSHYQQTLFLNRCYRRLSLCTFLLQNSTLWDICLIHCRICEMGIWDAALKPVSQCQFANSWFNSLGRSDAKWRYKSGSTLAQLMTFYPTASRYHLNECWLLISEIPWNSPENNFTVSV